MARDGRDGRNGRDGQPGLPGPLPRHEWDGTKLRFQRTDNTWGEWVDLEGPVGPEGKSAYALAVESGFEGDLGEWLVSLRGDDGKSAFELSGFADLSEWLESLKGPKGDKGDSVTGPKGKDGRNGKDGKDGQQGEQGPKGDDGLSAYEVWLQTHEGTENDFFKWLATQFIKTNEFVNKGGGPLNLRLKDLKDVDPSGAANGQALVYNSAQKKWVPGAGGGGSSVWGGITGDIADQTDLQTALGLKADTADLATVAFSGDYNDLDNLPALGTMAAEDASDYSQTSAFNAVAFSGDYADLTGAPSSLPPSGAAGGSLGGTYPNPTVVTNANLTGDIVSTGNATTYNGVLPANKGGAGTVNGILKANGLGVVSAASGSDYQAPISLTTVGSSGPATFIANTLNIPAYSVPDPVFFGSGSDGNVTVTTTITLTRDMYYNNLTISGAGIIRCANYRVFVKGTLDLTAAGAEAITVLKTAGTSASSTSGGGSASNVPVAIYLATPNGSNGGAGAATTGNAAAAPSNINVQTGGAGGASGKGGNGTSGNGGASTAPAAASATYSPEVAVVNHMRGAGAIGGGSSAAGGGGGGGDGTAGGGGGGGPAGGGITSIYANIISRGGSTAAGAISAVGGAGGNGFTPVAGNRGGGGGGGGAGGGMVYIVYNSLTGSSAAGAIVATGGAGGNGAAGSGTGTAGDGGTGGTGGKIILINLGTGAVSITTGSAGSAASGTTGGAGGACTAAL